MVSLLGLAFLLFVLVVLLLALLLYRRQWRLHLRRIAAFAALPGQIGRATESGQMLHLSLGTGGIGGTKTAASLAALSTLTYLAEQGVAAGAPPLVTISDPTLLPLAQNVLRQAYVRRGRRVDFRWTQVRLVSPSPMSYALGTTDILNHEPVLANVMFGSYGPEVGLIAGAGIDTNLIQISGSDNPQALSILYTSADQVAVGEELYATEVYLNRTAPKLVSLAVEDLVRIILILFVILVAILRWIGAL
jgi:hypothetical protein